MTMDNSESQTGNFMPVRRRYVRSCLKSLDENSGTGPDGIAARVLYRCRAELELPILLLSGLFSTTRVGLQIGDIIGSTHYTKRNPELIQKIIGEIILPLRSLKWWNILLDALS